MGVPYTFGTATTSIPLSQLDANFNTTATLGNTAVGLGNTTTTVGNLTLTNATISSGTVTVTSISDSGNLTFTGTGNRIIGDFSNATVANRVLFQTSTTNGSTVAGLIPNGTGTQCAWNAYNGTDTANAGVGAFLINTNELRIQSNAVGTGSYVPITMYTGGSERLRIDTSGNVGIGTSSPAVKLEVNGTGELLRLDGSGNQNRQIYLRNVGTGTAKVFTDGTMTIGSNDVYPLTFITSDAERMRIDSSGNVGIGCTPSAVGAYRVLELNNTTGGMMYMQANGSRVLQIYGAASESGIYNVGSSPLAFGTANTERMRISSSGNVGIGTSSPSFKLQINVAAGADALNITDASSSDFQVKPGISVGVCRVGPSAGAIAFQTDGSERMRLTSGGDICFAKTSSDTTTLGGQFTNAGSGFFYLGVTNTSSTSTHSVIYVNRQSSDGELIAFRQADSTEGNISVSGTTVSYNGGHLSRYAQTLAPKDNSLLKGTVLSNLDEMNEYVDAEGNQVDNEQLNKVKVSDVEGDVNVAGVFVNWSHDEAHNVDEINMAMTGDMIIRIAQGVVVQKGDLLMSAGDGTAKPQGDDIVRSKTVAKVTSNHVTCTYADGSYCVPCVLMAC